MAVVITDSDVYDTEDLRRRAYAGYFRSPGAAREVIEGDSKSEVVKIDDRVYVCLSSQSVITGPGPVKYPHIAAIFRLNSLDGQLRRLRRYPQELIERYEG
jgi:hypothetical protein